MHKVFQKSHIADIVPFDNIFQQDGAIDIHLVLPCILFVKSYLFQTRQSSKLNILCQRIITVGQIMKLHEFLVA